MENWSNLTIYLDKSEKDLLRYDTLAKKLIDFCLNGEKENIKKTLKEGAPINCYDEHITPLIAAIQNDNMDLVYYLLKAGARISFKPKDNFENALWFALKNKKHDVLEIFIKKKCILEWSNYDEKDSPKTPLIYCTINSDLKGVEILLTHYAIKVNERDGLGNTALHYNVSKESMSQEDIEIGRLLIAAGADTASANIDGKTPEDLAQDFAAKSMLLAGVIEKEIEVKEEFKEENEEELDFDLPPKNPNVTTTKSGKMKI